MGFGCCICNESLYQKTKTSLIVGDTSKVERPIVASKCGHLFHNDCLKNWFVKQGSEVWTTRHCPKCDMTLTVATDVIRIFSNSATDANSEDLDDANARIKKLTSDKEELAKRLESSFLQCRDSQKLFNKLEKEHMKRKGLEVSLREEILQLRKENEELKNTIVRISNRMTRGEPPGPGVFMNGSPMMPPHPPPHHMSQFYGHYPGTYHHPMRPNFPPYPHPAAAAAAYAAAMGLPMPPVNGFRPYLPPYPQIPMQKPQIQNPASVGSTKLNNNSKNKQEHYGPGPGTDKKSLDNYGNNVDSSDNEGNSDSDIVKVDGKSEMDESTQKFYSYFENGSASPPISNTNSKEKRQQRSSTPEDPFFEAFFKNTNTNTNISDDKDMLRFIEEEQILASRLANQNLNGSGKRIFGKYKCTKCGAKWGSARSEENQLQRCVKCKSEVYPYEQGPVLSKPELRALRGQY